jgi:hypothetical protein
VRRPLAQILAWGIAAWAVLSPGEANAWFRVCNQTTHTVWVSYAHEATCSWPDSCSDGCGGTYETRLRGWYEAAPGVCTTPNGDEAYQYSHWVYAEDAYGHSWRGGSGGSNDRMFQYITWPPYSWCCNQVTRTSPPYNWCENALGTTSPSRSLSHIMYRTNADNYTLNLLP